MKIVSKLLAMSISAGLFLGISMCANAQAGLSYLDGGGLTSKDADVVRLVTRPPDAAGVYGFYVILSVPFTNSVSPAASGATPHLTCLKAAGADGGNNAFPVSFSNRADSKVIRETLQLAFALNKRVRVYANQCITSDNVSIYPVIWAVETL